MPFWNFNRLVREVALDTNRCIAFCEREKLIPSVKLCSKGQPMKITMGSSKHAFGEFYCKASHHGPGGEERCTRFRDTWFEGAKAPAYKVLMIALCFANDYNLADTIRETSDRIVTSASTIINCFVRCREIIAEYVLSMQDYEDPIGGTDEIIEIRQFRFGRAKYKYGRFKEGYLVLGMVEMGSKRFKIEIIPPYSEDEISTIIVPLIQKHVRWGSNVFGNPEIRDCLKDNGYGCVKSCAETPFGTRTLIALKSYGAKKDSLGDRFIEFLFKQQCHQDKIEVFDKFLDVIRFIYPE